MRGRRGRWMQTLVRSFPRRHTGSRRNRWIEIGRRVRRTIELAAVQLGPGCMHASALNLYRIFITFPAASPPAMADLALTSESFGVPGFCHLRIVSPPYLAAHIHVVSHQSGVV